MTSKAEEHHHHPHPEGPAAVQLKECPFCAEKFRLEAMSAPPAKPLEDRQNWICCRTCGASGPTGKTKAEGEELWNNRGVPLKKKK